MFEALDAFARALGDHFDAPVREIAHVARDLMPRGDALRKETIADSLHLPVNRKLARYLHARHPRSVITSPVRFQRCAILKELLTKMQSSLTCAATTRRCASRRPGFAA